MIKFWCKLHKEALSEWRNDGLMEEGSLPYQSHQRGVAQAGWLAGPGGSLEYEIERDRQDTDLARADFPEKHRRIAMSKMKLTRIWALVLLPIEFPRGAERKPLLIRWGLDGPIFL